MTEMKIVFFYFFFGLCVNYSKGQNLKELAPHHELKAAGQDWLIHEIDLQTDIYSKNNDQIVLSNGLISRTFEIGKSGSTISLKNLDTNEEFIRSIRPEAEVTINQITFPVGGLIGQPIHNYFMESWLDKMKVNPCQFVFESFLIENTKKRMNWKKRQEWMPKDSPWPSPGKRLTMTYVLPDDAISTLANEWNKEYSPAILFHEHFISSNTLWKVFHSLGNERNSFINEGKFGEIMAMSNHAVYGQIASPKNATVWELKLDPGTDRSGDWGPGLTLKTTNDEIIKFNLRTSENKVGITVNDSLKTYDFNPMGSAVLRIKQVNKKWIFEISRENGEFETLQTTFLDDVYSVDSVKVGKTDHLGGTTDHVAQGESGRIKMMDFKIMGHPVTSAENKLEADFLYLKEKEVKVIYEMFDGIPLLTKWIEIQNNSSKDITLNAFKSEILAFAEPESAVDEKIQWIKPNISLASDFRFGGMSDDNLFSSSISWKEDLEYTSQVNYNLKTPTILEASPRYGPEKKISAGEKFESFRIWELVHDNWDRERQGLAIKRMYRSQAPWVTENPIIMHVRSADDASVMKAIDQCAEVGFEMVIMTFGSGFQMENNNPENLTRMKKLAEYAHTKGIALGGYSLLASRSIGPETDVVMPEGKSPRFGNSPCLGSEWGREYFEKLYQFFEETGHDILEHDGSYPGDICISQDHPGHDGLEDSQWNQYQMISEFYKWARGKGIYLNVPDHYFMAGSNKTGMGYREVNWSLPREQQEIIERQNIYDGTWEKTPSMGWMFVPLVEYHGGGKEATIEPLKAHLKHYGQRMANLFGAGVQACYRGPQLYDSPETKTLVKKWVDFYKKYREVLDADIVHIRRPDGRDYDGILHVNPFGKDKGFIMLYNPTEKTIQKKIPVQLYYTGIKNNAILVDNLGKIANLPLDRSYKIDLQISIPPKGYQWFLVNPDK